MKVKTSITISDKLIKMIDSLPESPARSEIIEEALIYYFKSRKALIREQKDLEILNSISDKLNDEAHDVLKYQK